LKSELSDKRTYGSQSHLEGLPQDHLVNIPIKVFPATESSATISFNQLHGRCRDAHSAEAVVPALQPRGAAV
jgi:hypothetical protein